MPDVETKPERNLTAPTRYQEAIASANHEWDLLDEGTRRLYCLDLSHSMREVFLLQRQIHFLCDGQASDDHETQ